MAGVRISESITVGGPGLPLVVIAGPCVIESFELCRDVAAGLKEICSDLNLPFVFKASFDKANRTSMGSFRGPGIEEGLEILKEIRHALDVPVLTDIHGPGQAEPASRAVDILQIPAFLCRQTDLIAAAAATGLPVNVKKGQFMSPRDMKAVVEKAKKAGNNRILLCERGTFFGYGDLVVDIRSIPQMKAIGCPVVFDVTHSTQKPGALHGSSGGDRQMALPLARAAVAAGADAVFIETHPDPDQALSDAASMIPVSDMHHVLKDLKALAS